MRMDKSRVFPLLFVAAVIPSTETRAADEDCAFTNAINLGQGVNTTFQEVAPDISSDGLTLVFHSDRPGGFGSMDLYQATRRAPHDPFDNVTNLGPAVNTGGFEHSPAVSGDGLTLYFSAERVEGFGSGDIYVATRATIDEEFGDVRNVGRGVNTEFSDSGADVTADGLVLVFISTRPDGFGDRDIWMATRTGDEWDVRNLGPEVNTSAAEFAPSISADGLCIYFNANRSGGSGGHDLYRATRDNRDELFGDLCWLGGINTGAHETGASINRDGRTLYFSSNRGGGFGENDLWVASSSKSEVRFLRGDCNDDGTVDISDAGCILNWRFLGGRAPGCIAVTNTNGDGGTDISDATYLLNYLFGGGPAPVAPFPDCGVGRLPSDPESCETPPESCQG